MGPALYLKDEDEGMSTSHTDRQTDGRTTYDSNTALALRAWRGKNYTVSQKVHHRVFVIDSSNIDTFSKFFQCHNLQDICNISVH